MKKIITISVVVAVVAIAGLAVARANTQGWRGHGCFGHRWGHWGPAAYVGHELGLNDAQRKQIASMWQTEKPAVAGLVQELAAENREMHGATANGTNDESKVQEIAARQGATISKLIVEKEHFTAKVYANVLTADQRTKADKLQGEWSERFEHFSKGLE